MVLMMIVSLVTCSERDGASDGASDGDADVSFMIAPLQCELIMHAGVPTGRPSSVRGIHNDVPVGNNKARTASAAASSAPPTPASAPADRDDADASVCSLALSVGACDPALVAESEITSTSRGS